MSIEVYYFSGTGNSLAVARDIAEQTRGKLISISSVINRESIQTKESKDTNLTFREMIPLTDKSIFVDDKCTGCGTCSKVCPAQNIQIIENKPVWLHQCEMCLACDEWCPKRAIRHWCKQEGKDYHHPDIKISDMLRQNQVT